MMIGTEGWIAISVCLLVLGLLYFLHTWEKRSRLGASSHIGEGKLDPLLNKTNADSRGTAKACGETRDPLPL